ncbi:carboxymuconolactone decarboxylase family protein [Chachezhania antarctica]|uniref:carboxymuconolactone decarboxylase family protein n=1 Tax=Chachezhania antarctica TaxID=2340860 RepID=UPI000EB07007|nr:carboxymuconolactone decarboxylase family protein [Chachezhania antarctica]|tara:strand:+ start:4203 stop:4766 length:564 start_codon:yes stop_codon:yes gene_type:complete
MTDFTLHTEDTAPEASKPLMAKAKASYCAVLNLQAVMAEAPGLLEAYLRLHELVATSSFSAKEVTVLWQAINVEHNCIYCVPAHTAIARQMRVSDAITDALRDGTPLPTARLEALRAFALEMVRERGVLGADDVQAFLDAGYTQRNVLEVILACAQKVMSNYTSHLAQVPLDKPFRKFAWGEGVSVW